MTKALSIILLICVLGGGIYFSKNYMKKGVSEGTPIGEVVKSGGPKYRLESSFGPSVLDKSYVNVDYKITILETNNLDTLPVVKISCPTNVSGKFSQNGKAGVEKCNTSIPFSLFTKSSSDPKIYYLTLAYKNTGTSTQDVVAEGFLDNKSIGKVSNGLGSTTEKPPFFNGFAFGPTIKPIAYVVTKKSNGIPKIKIVCPENIFAFDKSLIDSFNNYVNVCGKLVPMKDSKIKTYEGENIYNFGVFFINQTQTSIPVSAEAQFDGKTIKLDKDVLILPTNSNFSEIPKG